MRAAVAALVVFSVASAASAGAKPVPGLVYSSPGGAVSLMHWIYHARPDGSRPLRLTYGTGPRLSPDGRLVAFLRVSQRTTDLLLVSAFGGPARLLRHVRGFATEPVWSPDSRRLVSVEEGRLVLVDTASGSQRQFAGRGAASPSFAPDGHAIAYTHGDERGSEVFVYDVSSRRTAHLTHDERSYEPVWGPRGIAFARLDSGHGDVWLARPDGRPRRLTATSAGIVPVAWSHDGRRLLAANPPLHNGRLWAVEVPSGSARALTGLVGDLYAQGLSRDGRTVLAAIGCGGLATDTGVVETIPFAGGRPHVVVRGPCRASWNG